MLFDVSKEDASAWGKPKPTLAGSRHVLHVLEVPAGRVKTLLRKDGVLKKGDSWECREHQARAADQPFPMQGKHGGICCGGPWGSAAGAATVQPSEEEDDGCCCRHMAAQDPKLASCFTARLFREPGGNPDTASTV